MTAFAANVIVFLAAIGAAVGGSLAMVKRIKEGWESAFPIKAADVTRTQIVGGQLQEAFGHEVAAAVEVNTVALNEHADELREVKNALCNLRDEMREHRGEMREHRHAIDRWLDRMNR